jgi:hypothetical protein
VTRFDSKSLIQVSPLCCFGIVPVDLNRRCHLEEGDGGKENLVLIFACSSQKLKAWRKGRRILHAGKFFLHEAG